MIKEYEIIDENKNNVIIHIPFKGIQVKVEFSGGNNYKGVRAHLYTRDKFVQKVLDESDLRGKMYRLKRIIEEAGDIETKSPVAVEKKEEKKKKKEKDLNFQNLAEAITYIAAKYSVSCENKEDVAQVLESKGLTFKIG